MSWKSFQTDYTVSGIFPAPLFAANMFCSITPNFTVDKICVKFFVDSQRKVAYNPKKIERKTTIKRINEHEKRIVVMMDVKFGNEIINAEFSLADREKFEYQALIGRNIISGRAIVDPSISNTLH